MLYITKKNEIEEYRIKKIILLYFKKVKNFKKQKIKFFKLKKNHKNFFIFLVYWNVKYSIWLVNKLYKNSFSISKKSKGKKVKKKSSKGEKMQCQFWKKLKKVKNFHFFFHFFKANLNWSIFQNISLKISKFSGNFLLYHTIFQNFFLFFLENWFFFSSSIIPIFSTNFP